MELSRAVHLVTSSETLVDDEVSSRTVELGNANIVKASGDIFNISNSIYNFSHTWSFFGLVFNQTLSRTQWKVSGHCQLGYLSCAESDQCQSLHDCRTWADENKVYATGPFWLREEHPHFCSGLIAQGETKFKSYNIRYVSTIGITSFPGLNPNKEPEEPGFTISDVPSAKNYGYYNARITEIWRAKIEKAILEEEYLFVEDLSPTQTIVHASTLKKEIIGEDNNLKFVPDPLKSSCLESNASFFISDWFPRISGILQKTKDGSSGLLSKRNDDLSGLILNPFVIVRSPTLEAISLETLFNREILGADGSLQRWTNLNQPIVILDPCHQLILTLRVNPSTGNYYFRLPANASLTGIKKVCIAIRAEEYASMKKRTNERNLYLIEATNNTKSWRNSSDFIGLVSPDYVDRVNIKFTLKATPSAEQSPSTNNAGLDVSIQFQDVRTNDPSIVLKTSFATECQIALSPQCPAFKMSTLNSQTLEEKKKIPLLCAYMIYGRISYSCDKGRFTGHVSAPAVLTSVSLIGGVDGNQAFTELYDDDNTTNKGGEIVELYSSRAQVFDYSMTMRIPVFSKKSLTSYQFWLILLVIFTLKILIVKGFIWVYCRLKKKVYKQEGGIREKTKKKNDAKNPRNQKKDKKMKLVEGDQEKNKSFVDFQEEEI